MKQLNNDPTSLAYNKAVKAAYFKLWKLTQQLLATIERHELRCTLQRQDRTAIAFGSKVHEVINPLIYLSLECNDDELLSIHFGFEQLVEDQEYSHITSRFVRLLYKLTSKDAYPIDIENCVRTDWFINSSSELYSYIEDRNKYHTFKRIKYKCSI